MENKKFKKFLKEHYEDNKRTIKDGQKEDAEKQRAELQIEAEIQKELSSAVDTLTKESREILYKTLELYIESVEHVLANKGYTQKTVSRLKRTCLKRKNGRQFVEIISDNDAVVCIGEISLGKLEGGRHTFHIAVRTPEDLMPKTHIVRYDKL